ncbi:MAG: MBL fold metallo-hydrolase [Gammaproteobacteria bacterium]
MNTTKPLPGPAHHTANGFRNVPDTRQNTFRDLLKWQWQRRHRAPATANDEGLSLAANDPAALAANRTRTTATWIGHATVLVQMGGRNVLTDPQFSLRASPVQWAGPRRVVPPGLALDALPPIDVVLISHDHYDSLDAASVGALHERGGGQTLFFVPLGLKRWFRKRGIGEVIELDWWDSAQAAELQVTCLPTVHWSKRLPWERNRTLWAGWAVRSADFHFIFVGDSAYPARFLEIGQRLGPFDLAAIPIGAYEPRWFMTHHMTPEQAVAAHVDLQARRSIAIHWGTFVLSDEPVAEPAERLVQARAAAGLAPEEFTALRHGQTVNFR